MLNFPPAKPPTESLLANTPDLRVKSSVGKASKKVVVASVSNVKSFAELSLNLPNCGDLKPKAKFSAFSSSIPKYALS